MYKVNLREPWTDKYFEIRTLGASIKLEDIFETFLGIQLNSVAGVKLIKTFVLVKIWRFFVNVMDSNFFSKADKTLAMRKETLIYNDLLSWSLIELQQQWYRVQKSFKWVISSWYLGISSYLVFRMNPLKKWDYAENCNRTVASFNPPIQSSKLQNIWFLTTSAQNRPQNCLFKIFLLFDLLE